METQENKLKIAVDYLNLAQFGLPQADISINFNKPDYDYYLKDPVALVELGKVYNSLLYYTTMLLITLCTQISPERIEDLEKLKLEIENNAEHPNNEKLPEITAKIFEIQMLQDFVPLYLRYMFYKAVIVAQNGVLHPYVGNDWDTDELSKFVTTIGENLPE